MPEDQGRNCGCGCNNCGGGCGFFSGCGGGCDCTILFFIIVFLLLFCNCGNNFGCGGGCC